ncbi:tetratricopeptide repeat protein 16 isoform X2 [Mastacembelus armatus]|uniref:Tetratricopeptide repeat domain 16 n=1 Tax=Mastacembelus armatus TaxID=205130 RepID=A0A3Q3MM71_9TELE|nr:tetratricopeptide repeat protein 16 isoform X2 [Mastacembelus armatus]
MENHQTAEEQSLFPTAVSEEELDEARRKNTFKQLFGSSKVFLVPGENRAQRPGLQGSLIVQSKAAEHYTNGNEAMGKSQYEKAVICFSRAITLQPEQTQLYVSQAEAYLQLCDFQSAAACYKRAWLLEPGAFSDRLAFIYYLQGQCLYDRGLFLDALKAFGKAAEVKPGCRAYAVRSLACLTAAGHHSECLKLLSDWMVSDGATSDLYVLRARLLRQLNQTSQCYQDVKSALALNPTCPGAGALLLQLQEASERARQQAVGRALTGQLPEALCMINVALGNSPQDGRLYLFRGILYRRLKDFTAAIEDLVQAVELSEEEQEKTVRDQAEVRDQRAGPGSVQREAEFQLVLTYNDFAVQCFSRGLYAEATLLLNKAIEEEKGQAGLYLNRGDCFFKQGEWCYALADYQQAEEMMQPDDPAVQLRLAVLYNTLGSLCFQDGCFHQAADMFSLAIRYNPTVGQYYESRSKAFRKILNLDGARQDLIHMLILDPNNEEVPPMLMSLFPGCSVSDVLSSPAGQVLRLQLTDTIQAHSRSSDQHRLNEAIQNMTLASEDTSGPSEDTSAAGMELKLCVNQQEMQIIVKSLLQVKETASSFFHHTGPQLTPQPPSIASTSGASASGASASGASASGASASGASASGPSTSGASASGASASGPSTSGASASGASASGPSTSGASASGASASGASASGPSASGASSTSAVWNRTSPPLDLRAGRPTSDLCCLEK